MKENGAWVELPTTFGPASSPRRQRPASLCIVPWFHPCTKCHIYEEVYG
jgi:hypothetical protein